VIAVISSKFRTSRSSATIRDAAVIDALNGLVAQHSRWGFWKCYDRLRLDGHRWNHKRLWRVYRALGLHLLRRAKRRVPTRLRQPLAAPPAVNQVWAVDFMHDAPYGGRRFRTLNVLDEGNREGLTIDVGTSLPAARVIRVLDQLTTIYGRPAALRSTTGPRSPRPCSPSGARPAGSR
jgi:putative transposase